MLQQSLPLHKMEVLYLNVHILYYSQELQNILLYNDGLAFVC